MKLSDDYVKKKIMFNIEEDVYFITYHLIIILIAFQCKQSERYLKDYNKLALLITISEKKQYKEVIRKVLENKCLEAADKQRIFEIYYNSSLKKRSIRGIIFTLDSKGIIQLRKNRKTIDITLDSSNVASLYSENILFKEDIEFYKYIGERVSRVTIISLETMEERILGDIRGTEWQIY